MINSETRKGKAAGWTALLSSITALAGTGVSGYLNHMKEERDVARATQQQAQLDRAWEMTHAAVTQLQDDARDSDDDLTNLRVAVAELKATLEAIHGRRRFEDVEVEEPKPRRRARRPASIGTVGRAGGASAPVFEGVTSVEMAEDSEPEEVIVEQIALPSELPAPAPEQLRKAAQKIGVDYVEQAD